MVKTMTKTRKTILCIILSVITLLALGIGLIWLNKPTTSIATTQAHNHGSFTAWGEEEDERGSLPTTAGSYYLTNDISLSDTWTVSMGTFNLCLNGHNVTMSEDSNVISVSNGATLNIYECDETEQDVFGVKTVGGKISCLSKTERNIVVKGTLNMYGGTVFGAKTGIYLSDGTFNMYGGYITANSYSSEETDTYGGGVLIDGGTFTMDGGKIYGNRSVAQGQEITLHSFGAGVFVDGEGSFTMNGGEIYGNESEYGSGIYLKDGTFTMNGGEIHDNGSETGDSFGSGLYVSENGTASLTGGKIYNNTSSDKDGGAGVCCKGKLSLGGTVQIVNNTHDYEDGGKSNLSFHNSGENYINLISPKDGMLVGISMPSANDHFTEYDEEEQGNEKYFFADREDEYVIYNGWIGLRQIKDSYSDYKIDIGTSEHGIVYSNCQGAEKALIEDGITVCLTTVPEKGYGLKSLKVKFDNGEEYDITETKSFVMIEENATVTAEFDVASFKAVFDETDSDNKTLTFYYDAVDYSGDNKEVFDNLRLDAKYSTDWGYDGKRASVKAVIFDKSIENFHGLTSTASMLFNMTIAEDIKGVEYLDVSSVTDMNSMFSSYGYSSTSLNNVPNVEKWNTAQVTDMNNMFSSYGYSSTSLNNVPNVENWNTAQVTDMSKMFSKYGYSSTSLNNVPNVEKWNMAQVTNMMSMFSGYGYSSTSLNNVPNVENWNTALITNMSSMFSNYGYSSTSLNNVPNVENWNTALVSYMSNMFLNYGNSSKVLNNVPNVENWNTAQVTEMNSMFSSYGRSSIELTAVPNLENWNTAQVTNMNSMFYCYGFTSPKLIFTLDLSGWNLNSVSLCGNVFYMAGKQTSNWQVIIPATSSGKTNTASTWNVGIDGSFTIVPANGKSFSLLSFKAVFDENGEKNTLTFYFDNIDHSGEKITVFDNLRTDAKYDRDWGYHEKRASVKAVIFDKSIENFHGLTSTASMLFNMTIAESIKGVEYLDVSNVTNMNSMFQGFGYSSTSLNNVPNVENWNTAQVTDMSSMFRTYGYSSTSLNNVPNVENWNTALIMNMLGMFQYYGNSSTSLNNVPNVENWNTALITNMSCMFQGFGSSSTSLNNVPNVENWDTSKVTNMMNMFQDYGRSSTELTAVPNVENWNTALITNMITMFSSYGYTSQKLNFTLDLSGWNLSMVSNGANMFGSAGNATTLWEVKIPSSSSGKTNTTAEWHVGSDGSQVITPAGNRKFTLVKCYTISNGMPEANKEQNGGYIAVKKQSPQGKTVKVEVFANVGYVLNCLFYHDETDHDITDSKSFIMPKTQVAVTATFALCTAHVDSDENGICDKCGGEYVSCVHENTEVIYDLIDGNANCIASLVCTDCQEILLTETVATEIIEDTKATCTEKAKGHYKATFINTALGVKETDTNSVEYGVPVGHNFINYVCERCNVEDLSGAKTDSISAINTLIDGRTDTALLLLVDTAKSQIESESVTTLTKIFEIRDCWLATFENLLEIIHEHTYSAEWSYNGTHHWHDNLCDDCTVVSDFGVHTFDSGVKIGNKTTFTCTCCGYSYSENDPFINTESAVIFETIKFKGYSLLLSSDISINFYIELTEEQAENGVMEFTIGDRVITVNASYNANGYYFRCPLNTLEMATIVKAKFTYMNASVLKEYSVMDYINTVINGEYDAKLQALCKALATYGYYAQIELASIHDGVTIGDDGYTEVDYHNDLNLASAKSGLQYFGFVDDKKNSNIIGVGRSLSLDDKVAMNIYVQVKDGYTLTENMISVSDGKEFILVQVETNQYRITVLDIEATNLGTEYTINIDGESITTSALSYANKVVNGTFSASSQNAMTALYEYYLSAAKYVDLEFTVEFDTHYIYKTLIYNVKCGEKVTRPDPDPTDTSPFHYTFGGWYKDQEYTIEWDFDKDIILKDTVIYGKWIGYD